MQGTQVWSLVQEDPTWHAIVKPMCHNYWACAVEPRSYNYSEPMCLNDWSPTPWSPCSTTREATAVNSLHTATREKPRQQRRPSTSKNEVNSVSGKDISGSHHLVLKFTDFRENMELVIWKQVGTKKRWCSSRKTVPFLIADLGQVRKCLWIP